MTVVRARLRVEGVVQGVGFRPLAHSLATRLGLGGLVGNDSDGVFVEVEGDAAAVGAFQDALHREAPPLAVIERVTAEPLAPLGERAFSIVASRAGAVRHTLVSPDTATCADCLAEIDDPADRRFRHPFASCTHCGRDVRGAGVEERVERLHAPIGFAHPGFLPSSLPPCRLSAGRRSLPPRARAPCRPPLHRPARR
jgi:acylphosphatase